MGGGSSPDWLSDQQLLQTLISFYRREIVGTVGLHSLQSLQLKKTALPGDHTLRRISNAGLPVCSGFCHSQKQRACLCFLQAPVKHSCSGMLLDHDLESQEVRKSRGVTGTW